MPKAKLTFSEIHQDSQEYGSDNVHMVSRVFFTLEVKGTTYPCYVDIKQTVGSNFETGSIEVGRPQGCRKRVSYWEFRNAAESYYRELVGSSGTGIRISDARNVRMRDNVICKLKSVEIEVGGREGGR
jgi:hypothetical protein